MLTFFKRLWKEEEGQDLVEYTLLLAFIAIGSAAIITTIGGDVKTVWTATSTHMAAAAAATQ